MGSSLYLSGGVQSTDQLLKTITQNNTFSAGTVVRWDGTAAPPAYVKAQADNATNAEVAGIVSTATSTQFTMVMSGHIDLSSASYLSGFTAPALFLSADTAGVVTPNPPSVIGSVVKPLLLRKGTAQEYIVTNFLGTQIGGSSTVAIDEIQPVGTIMPFAGSTIPDSWLACDGASYAIATYPNLYAKLQNSSGDRVPAYGYIATLTGPGAGTANFALGDMVQFKTTAGTFSGGLYDSNADIIGIIISISGTVPLTASGTITVQVLPNYNSNTKKFQFPNTVFTAGTATPTSTGSGNYRVLTTPASTANPGNGAWRSGNPNLTVSAVATTHFNTPDLRGRFALGANATAITEVDGDLSGDANYSSISAYTIGSEGGQESTVVDTAGVLTGTTNSRYTTTSSSATGLLSNMPPYTVVRYIIKATPYTRAAIIDGIDIPYTSLLVGDLRDGSLRPGGSGEDLIFKTNDGTSGVERMRLTNKGVLTLTQAAGYSSGVYMIGAAANTMPSVKFYNPDTATNKYAWWSARDGHAFSVESNSVDGDAGTYRLMVSENGNVSIGAQPYPLAALDINGSSGGNNQIWIRPGSGGDVTGATAGLKLEFSGNTANIQAYDYTTGSPSAKALALNSLGGNVGVGTNAATAKLQIDGANGTVQGLFVNLSGTDAASVSTTLATMWTRATAHFKMAGTSTTRLLLGGVGASVAGVQSSNASGGAALDMAIQPYGGKVGIGITGPSVALHILGEARASIGTTAGSNAKTLTTKDYVDTKGEKFTFLPQNAITINSWVNLATLGVPVGAKRVRVLAFIHTGQGPDYCYGATRTLGSTGLPTTTANITANRRLVYAAALGVGDNAGAGGMAELPCDGYINSTAGTEIYITSNYQYVYIDGYWM